MKWRTCLTVLLLGAALGAQEPGSIDEQRSAWRYRRDVTAPPGHEHALWAVPIPPEVQAEAQPRLRDLRLVNDEGAEVSFLILDDVPRVGERRWVAQLTEVQQERRRPSIWTVDFGSPITFDRLELDVPGSSFATRIELHASTDGGAWRPLGGDFWVFDRRWESATVHDTALNPGSTEARFLRVVAQDSRSPRLNLKGLTAVRTDRLAGSSWSEDVDLELLGTSGGRTRYRIPIADGHPVRRVALDADDPAFARQVRIIEQRAGEEHVAASGQLYRVDLPEASLNVNVRELPVERRLGGALLVEVQDGDNAPLTRPRVRLSGPRTLLVTSSRTDTLRMYYGNTVTRAAVYDLERLRTAIALVPEFPVASLGPEAENPAFRQPAPLAFVAARGASVDPASWRFARPVRVTGAEDLYTAVVSPVDRARLRRDLGDLRIVDEGDRQVPYVLEPRAESAQVELTVAPTAPRQGRPQVSAYRLTAPPTGPGADPMRFVAVRLRFADSYFRRPTELIVPRSGAPLGGDTVATSVLAVPGDSGVVEPAWMQIGFDDVAARELVLEITDGDNAPLTLLQAQGVVQVPRLTFKAAAGNYRLLLGNPDAAAPSYELGALRREVLAYSAVPLDLSDGTTGTNPAYEPGLANLLRRTPPAAVLWIALGAAVVVLLALTRRILSRGA